MLSIESISSSLYVNMELLLSPWAATLLFFILVWGHIACITPPNVPAPRHTQKRDVSKFLETPSFVKSALRFSWVSCVVNDILSFITYVVLGYSVNLLRNTDFFGVDTVSLA
jgi:hypothetical protein